MSKKTEIHSVRNGLGQVVEIFWKGPGMYAQTAEHSIIKVADNRTNRPSRYTGTAFWRRTPEEIKDSF